jgi:hypothetical protein
MPRVELNYFYCNKPAGFRGRCVRLPRHKGYCSVGDTLKVMRERAQAAEDFAEELWEKFDEAYEEEE